MKQLIRFLIVFTLSIPGLSADDVVDDTREVGEKAAALERLLDGLRDGERLDVTTKKKVLLLLKDLKARNIGGDVDHIIEDLEDDDPESAGDIARNLLLFLQKMRTAIAEDAVKDESKPPEANLDSILQEQKDISKLLADLMKELGHPMSDQVNQMASEARELEDRKLSSSKEAENLQAIEEAVKKGDLTKLKEFTGTQDEQTARKRLEGLKDRLKSETGKRQQAQKDLADKLDKLSKDNANLAEMDAATKNALDKAAEELRENKPGSAAKKLDELMKKFAKDQLAKMTPEQKKTIEHLKTRQEQLADKLKDHETSSPDEDSKKTLHETVDQMTRLANMFKKGELDSGLWESRDIEDKLKELIKKQQFEQNKYAMDQKLVKMSDFIKFAEELLLKQTDLQTLWKGVATPSEKLLSESAETQEAIELFSRSKDTELAEAKSLAFTYGLKRIQETLSLNVQLLAKEELPDAETQTNLLRDMQELIDGLKKLRGRLADENNRPDKRESHDGQDSEQPAVSLIEEMRYLRLLQMHLNEQRLENPENKRWSKEQRDIQDMLLQLRARWMKKMESKS